MVQGKWVVGGMKLKVVITNPLLDFPEGEPTTDSTSCGELIFNVQINSMDELMSLVKRYRALEVTDESPRPFQAEEGFSGTIFI